MEQKCVSAKPRLSYIDNLRWLMIVLVVLVHVCVTYSGLGSWYYKEARSLDIASTLVFYAFQIFCQAFFMGFLFLLAGHFVPSAFDRKGWGRFVLDRLLRLGAPTAVFMFVLHPVTVLIRDGLSGRDTTLPGLLSWYGHYVRSLSFLRESGPLWFALALLVFSIVYGLARPLFGGGRPPAARPEQRRAVRPSHGSVVALIAVMAAASFAMRMVQPVGSSWYNMQLCFFPQYVILFLVGLWTSRSGFLAAVSLYPLAKALLVASIALPAAFLFAALVRRVPGLKRLFS